jgi:hypothetical protein
MRRDSIGLAWLKRSILAGLIIFIHSTGKASGGHGDADDAATCKPSLLSRFDWILSDEASKGALDIKKLGTLVTVALYDSVRLMDCNLLDSDTVAIIQQDFEMRLCEWRALDSGSDIPSLTIESQLFISHTVTPNVPPAYQDPAYQDIEEFAESTTELANEPASELMKPVPLALATGFDVATICRTALEASAFDLGKIPFSSFQPATDLRDTSSVNEEQAPAKVSFTVEISAIESAIQVRPWGYRFTRDNLLSYYHFSGELQTTKLYDEEYRPYDFFEVPEASEVPAMAEVSSIAEMQSLSEANVDSESIVTSPAPDKELSISSYVPMGSISDSIASAQSVFSATYSSTLDQAKLFLISKEFNLQNLLFERVQQSTPFMNQMAITATGYGKVLAHQHWLTNGIRLAISWNSLTTGREKASDEASESLDPSVVRHDLRQVFGASVLADPFAADCSLVIKRPPTLASPKMVELVATEADDSGEKVAYDKSANAALSDADVQDSTTYELLVLLQDASWMADSIESNFSEGSDSVEIGLSKIDDASTEPKSASLTPENAGIGVSQR